MTTPLVGDELWAIVAPLLPPEPPKPKGGRPRVSDRAARTGSIFVLKSGIPWGMLPRELGCGSGVACWRRLRDWRNAGVWDRLHRELLDRLGAAGHIDWSRACADSAAIPAKGGRPRRPQPDGSRQTGHEAPRCGRLRRDPACQPPDRRQSPRLRRLRGARRCGPAHPATGWPAAQAAGQAARGQGLRLPPLSGGADASPYQGSLRPQGGESSQRPGRHRWAVERTLAWPNRCRRLTIRYERRAGIHRAFLLLSCCLACFNALQKGV